MSSIFKPAEQMVRPRIKLALDGYQGSGKSLTAALILAGVHRDFGCKGPVFIMDNERSSKFLVPVFKEHGITDIQVVESDSLAVFCDALKEVEAADGSLLVDGLTKIHARTEDDYLKTVNRPNKKTIEIQDRPILNSAWRNRFEEPFIKANCNVIFTGRAAVEWANEIVTDERTGEEKRTFYAKGVKMAGQKESLYAPDYAIYMERVEELDNIKRDKKVWREATILKDRSRRLDGQTFKWKPEDVTRVYSDLRPMFDFLRDHGAPGEPNDVPGTAAAVFGPAEGNVQAFIRRREVALEELDGILGSAFPGQAAVEKKARQDVLQAVFGTYSKTKIEGMKAEEIESKLNEVRDWISTYKAGAMRPEAVSA